MSRPLAGVARIRSKVSAHAVLQLLRTPRSGTDITTEVNHVNGGNGTLGTAPGLDDTPAAQSYNSASPCRFQAFGAISTSCLAGRRKRPCRHGRRRAGATPPR